MTTHRIIYRGPASLALPAATALADGEGVELTSSGPPERLADEGDVVLTLTVEATTEAIGAALARLQEVLPPAASLSLGGDPA